MEGERTIVLGSGTLAKTGYTFGGWSLFANGNGKRYQLDSVYVLPENDVIFYAYWIKNRVAINKDDLLLHIGEEEILLAEVYPENASNKNLIWESTDPQIVTVANGKVKAIASGSVKIRAILEDGGSGYFCNVIVRGVSFYRNDVIMYPNETQLISASYYPSSTSSQGIIYESENVEIAKIVNGKVKALSPGSTTIKAYSEDGKYSASCSVIVERKFVSIWETASDRTITLPLVGNGNYNFTVYWGDGSSDVITSLAYPIHHEYSDTRSYRVEIVGTIEGWSFLENPESRKQLQEIKAWGDFSFGNSRGQFWGCNNMEITATDRPDLSKTISLEKCFAYCRELKNIPSINLWDTSAIISMSGMFNGASNFNGDLSDWNTSSVTDMGSMFKDASNFNGNLSDWNTSNVVDMSNMFNGAKIFHGRLSDWKTSSVTDMGYMFTDADAFNSDLSDWDTINVENMYSMFLLTDSFNGDISGWNTSNVTDMGSMFRYADGFYGDLSGWDFSNVTSMDLIFQRVSFSRNNYDKLLISMANQNIKKNVDFYGVSSFYSSGAAAEARQRLIDVFGWRIVDLGQRD